MICLIYINKFFFAGHLPKAFTTSFIILTLKKTNPLDLNGYHPICLIGSIYKIISKLLAGRVKKVIGWLISINQLAFISNRNMMNGVVLVNDLVNFSRRNKKSLFLFKVDFEEHLIRCPEAIYDSSSRE